jgi:uncharacterized protein
MSTDADQDGRSQRLPSPTRQQLAWFAALCLSAAFTIFSELERQPHTVRSVQAQIIGAVVLWLVLAAVIRGIIYVVALLGRVEAKPGRPARAAADASARPRRAGGDEGDREPDSASWPAPTQRARRWTVKHAVLALIASQVVIFIVALVLVALHIPIPLGAGGVITEAGFLVVLVPLYRSGRLRPVDLGLRRTPAARAVGLTVAALIAVSFLQALWTSAIHIGRVHGTLSGISHHSIPVIVLAGFAASIAAPFAEEVFFRGFLYRSLRNRLPIVPAAVIVGLIFAIGHTQYPLIERPNQAIFGIGMCLLYERTGSLWPGIAIHSFINASAFESALTGTSLIVAAIFLFLALAFLVRPAGRALRRTFFGGRVATE